MTGVPWSTTMRIEVGTADELRAALVVDGADQRRVVCRRDAGAWALRYCCPSDRVAGVVEVLADEPTSVGTLALPLSSCALRIGRRIWPVSPFDEIAGGMWSGVRIPAGGDMTVVSELAHSPVGAAVVALHLRAGRPPAMSELPRGAGPGQLSGRTHWAARSWIRRAMWARGGCTTGELALASRPRAGTDWRSYEVLNGYYHADELDRRRLPPLPTALRTWFPDAPPAA
jgi:hypothetical protein